MKIARPADVRLLGSGFSVGEALAAFNAAHPGAGGIASFCGKVRSDAGTKALELTHYDPLTLPVMQELAHAALSRWTLAGLLCWHRVGVMQPGAPIVLVAAAAAHRRAAFEATDYLMDHLKSAAWFWKRERRSDGWHWIQPRDQDHSDLARWAADPT
ncbi:Molybdopterin synthase [Alteripontixanthobacter maritimus]|uniref:Molybdopterin synthase catalytic subunit n=1 Tax=Alteripontixanthobacter maritimus TaxID=2161824 RepID=A0A369QBX6_9SPHN|nr:molybdenum cofactor biosynthesis protein MoaE [Alteripontixanthobacter maritimus]RDC60419.1 Molybdopterin synthase [Alteripontixanthobacter maritimus]